MRGSFLVQCPLNQNSTRSEASWLPFLAGWRAAKLHVLENYFPSQASRGFAVHLLRAHITVTHADCSFRVLSHILDISLRLVEWYCLYLVSSLHHVILNCVNAPRFLFGFNLLFQLFVAEALFEVSCIYICHICVWQDWYSTATIDILMIILSCFPEKIMKLNNDSAIELDNIMVLKPCFVCFSASEWYRRQSCDRGSSHAGLLSEYVIHQLKGHHKVTRIETSESGFSSLRICWTFSGKLLCRNFTS